MENGHSHFEIPKTWLCCFAAILDRNEIEISSSRCSSINTFKMMCHSMGLRFQISDRSSKSQFLGNGSKVTPNTKKYIFIPCKHFPSFVFLCSKRWKVNGVSPYFLTNRVYNVVLLKINETNVCRRASYITVFVTL